MFVLYGYNIQSQIHSHIQDVGVQCSLMAPVRHSTSVFLPVLYHQMLLSQSQGDFEILDLDTSAYTMQDDSSL